MKTFTVIMLILSLMLNACLAFLLIHTIRQNSSLLSTAAHARATTGSRPATATSVLSDRPTGARTGRLPESVHTAKNQRLALPADIAAKMRADGYPDEVIGAAISAAIRLRDQAFKLSLMGVDKISRWNPNPTISPETLIKLKELEAQQVAEYRALSSYNEHEALWHARDAQLKFGNLDPQKIQAVRQIEEDYARVSSLARQSKGQGRDSAETQNMLAREFEKDVRAALTPDEANEYLRYNSPAAKALQSTLGGLALDERTYGVLLDASVEAQGRMRSLANDPVQAANLQSDLFQKYSETLGAENFTTIMSRLDPLAASADAIFQAAHLSAAARVELFLEAHNATMTVLSAPIAERASLADQIYQSLVSKAGLSPEQIKAFDQTPFGAGLKRHANRKS